MQKLVSVIIPTFNRADQIVEAIKSVKAQTYPAIQIIVADDGSTDNTAEIVKQFEGVEYFYQENRGQGAARNLGLRHAKGDYIASLDSDDIWHDGFLTAAVGGLEEYQADFVFLNYKEIFEDEVQLNGWESSKKWKKYRKSPDSEWTFLNSEEVRRLFLQTCPAPSSALLIRRSLFNDTKWNEDMRIADDWCLILDMVLAKSCRAAFTMSHYWTKYVHASNIYHGREPLDIVKILGMHDEPLIAERIKKHLTLTEKSILQKRIAGHYLNYGRLNLKRTGFSLKDLRIAATAFRVAPLSSFFYIAQIFYYFLKNQFHLIIHK